MSRQVIELAGYTYTSVFKPSLESQFSGLRLSDAGTTLTVDPLHQDLLQLRVVLAVDLILNLPAQAVRRSFVSHADSLMGGQETGRKYGGRWDRSCGEGVKERQRQILT